MSSIRIATSVSNAESDSMLHQRSLQIKIPGIPGKEESIFIRIDSYVPNV